MPVSAEIERLQGELDRLYDRLDQYEEDTTDIVTSAYLDSVREAIDRIERRIAEADAPEEALAQTRLEVLENTDPAREVWETWRGRLKEIEGRVQESYELVASVDDASAPPLDKATLHSLRGQWPDGGSPVGSGLAGRFYNLNTHHRRALADAVIRQVTLGVDPDTLKDQLKEEMDIAENQAKQQVRDATIQHSRTVNAVKAKQQDVEYFRYRGPLDGLTRPFCEELLESGEVYSREEIEEMDNGQTGAGTVFVAGGGYNCRHRWLPVRKRWFEDDEFEGMRGDPSVVESFSTEGE